MRSLVKQRRNVNTVEVGIPELHLVKLDRPIDRNLVHFHILNSLHYLFHILMASCYRNMSSQLVDAIVSEDELLLPPRQWKPLWESLKNSGLLSQSELDAIRRARHLSRDRVLAAKNRASKANRESLLKAELDALRSEVDQLRAENNLLRSAIEHAGAIEPQVVPQAIPSNVDEELDQLFGF